MTATHISPNETQTPFSKYSSRVSRWLEASSLITMSSISSGDKRSRVSSVDGPLSEYAVLEMGAGMVVEVLATRGWGGATMTGMPGRWEEICSAVKNWP